MGEDLGTFEQVDDAIDALETWLDDNGGVT
jgi:hypothetical protein